MPMIRTEVEAALIRVRHSDEAWGLGFLAEPELAITAAHCLPRIPEHVDDDEVPVEIRIPIFSERVRSLNLSTSAGIVLYEALRQCGQLD